MAQKTNIQVRLDKEDAEHLKKKAEQKGHTISSLLRHLIKQYLKREK